VLLLAGALMVAAARGDLWLDEIWSMSFARQAKSWSDVLVRFRHDNNHVLNTLYLYCFRECSEPLVLRLLAIASGVASVLLIGVAARQRWGRAEALVGMVLLATSHPMLLYFSEARGYAPAVAFGLAAYVTIGPDPERRRFPRIAAFWLASLLGILAHATFVILSVALAAWHLALEIERRRPWRAAVTRLVAWHAPPLLAFAGWHALFLRGMEIGGGDESSTGAVVGQLAALVVGLPDSPGFRAAAVVVALGVAIAGIVALRRRRDAQTSFFPIVLLLSPAAMLGLARPSVLYFRYLLVIVPFFLLLSSRLLGGGLRSPSRRWRGAALGIVVALVAAQGPRVARLLLLGRGQYGAALEQIARESTGPIVRVGSDHDFRNRLVFDWYAPRVAGGDRLRYVEQSRWKSEPPDWILRHSQDLDATFPATWSLRGGGEFRLRGEVRFCGISGWNWFLFRRSGDG